MKKSNVKLTVLVGLIGIVGVVLVGYGVRRRSSDVSATRQDVSLGAASSEKRRVPVVLTPATRRTFEELAIVQGTLEAKTFATVAARVGGTIEKLFVEEGDTVVADETKLFQIDALKLQKTVEVRRQELAVARYARREKEANLERVEADLHKAEIDYHRYRRLHEDSVVPSDVVEQHESRYKQANAMRKHAQSLVDLGIEQEHQAEAALAMAEKDLRDALVYAPVSGVVSQRFREEGETADMGKPMLRIEDPSVVEVSAFLPAHYYARVVVGQTKVRINVYGVDVGDNVGISYKSPTIGPRLRTFEIKCVLHDPPEGVVPGAMAGIEVLLERHEGLGVPAGAVQERTGRNVVFVVKNNLASMVVVKTGLETEGWVELVDGAVREGAPVVSMGQYHIEDGTRVTVEERDA